LLKWLNLLPSKHRTIGGKASSIQTLQLTELQLRVLEAITPEKIADASLLDLAKAFKILKEAELGIKGEPFKITGLLAYLLKIEREDADQQASDEDVFLDDSPWVRS
jgi:hypothetical protein